MHYVYLLQSRQGAGHRYVGMTSDLRGRLAEHNNGQSPETADHLPWRLVTYVAFASPGSAARFEVYLKSAAGHIFAQRRLWSREIDPVEKFRKQICYSPFMQATLRRIQRDLCTVCGMPLWKRQLVVHHMDYAHQCDWAGTVHVKVAGKHVEVPDCGDCQQDDPARFEGCSRRLQLLHRGCHAEFHAGNMTMKPVV
jgi:predicted GIY-YIG superfamily endonuclease